MIQVRRSSKGALKVKCDDVFEKRIILPPKKFRVLDYPRDPVAVFNPGAVLIGDEIHVFPRLVFDYYKYTSAIGHFTLRYDLVEKGHFPEVIDVELIMWPQGREDLLGVEDPRAHVVGDEIWILYVGKGYDRKAMERKDYLGFAKFKPQKLERIGYFSLDIGEGPFYPRSNKDSTFLDIDGNSAVILTRPHLKDGVLGLWKGKADFENLVIKDPEMIRKPSETEEKLGWSTNAINLNGDWLVGWHSVMREDLSYRNGFAIVKNDGTVEFSEKHVLCPKGLLEEYGDRALVIFGCGLLIQNDSLMWIGGVSDYAIGIFTTSLKKAKEAIV
jgi:predicted GH43/DUF377 family glycosyl hydrolase